ncbi:hypothetical protein [Methylosinus sp. LW4]|uniref:hypothetical protein n=1 Tax=Methylosinus sp. LW4 TaxID=136993 RepID=UPI0012FB38AC|nr:hypothetical protein [Methylosinus sp. LW4]
MAAQRKNYGRYDHVEEAVHPGPALPRAPKRMKGKVEIVVAAVDDPNPVGAEKLRRQRVAVNVARDTLEREYAYGRITREQYDAGRLFERVLEAARIGGRCASTERIGGVGDHEAMIAKAMDRAVAAVDFEMKVRSACGGRATLILRAILGEGQTFTQIASAERLGATRGKASIAHEFRSALTTLAKLV